MIVETGKSVWKWNLGAKTWCGVEYTLGTDLLTRGCPPMTQDLMFWQGLLEPVLICCWNGPLRMSEWPQQSTEEGVRRLIEVGVFQWIYYVKPGNPPPKSVCPGRANRILSIKSIRNARVRGAL